jgi:hypothetical protein
MDDRQNSDFQRDDSPIPDNIPRPDGGQRSDSPQRDDSPRAGRDQPSAPGPQHGDAPYSKSACSAGSGTAAPQTAKHDGGCLKWILIILGALALISIFRGCVRDAYQKPTRSTVTAAPTAEPTPTPAAYVQSTYLTELDALRCDNVDIENRYDIEANTGNAYGHALSGESPYSEVIYNLSGNYDQLDGVWFICSNYKNTDNDQGLEIYADNVCVYTAPAITRGSLPVNVSVDITGCNLLTIRFTKGSYAGVLGDVVLSNKTDRTPNPEPYQPSVLPVWLTSLDSLTEDQVRASGGTAYANTGEVFAHCITISSIPFGEKVGSMEYYLAGKYAALSGVLCVSEDCKNIDTTSYFEIYADGEPVYTSPEMTQGSLPESFQVDIQHCQKLKIVLYGYNSFLGNLRLDP